MKPTKLSAILCVLSLMWATIVVAEAVDPFADPAGENEDRLENPAAAALMARLDELGPRSKGMGVGPGDDGVPELGVYMHEEPDLNIIKDLHVKHIQIMGNMHLLAAGKIMDIAPLAGVKLESLWIYKVPFNNLTPLKDSGLVELSVIGCPVSDLSPLQGLVLTDLNLWLARVSDLTPLKGMPLKHLRIDVEEPARITDLTPLAGMKLETLTLREDDVTTGMDVIRAMKSLKEINRTTPAEFWKSYDERRAIRERVHRSGLDLARLDVDEDGTCALYFVGNQIVDLASLKELPVTALFIWKSNVVDLQPLAGMRLEILSIGSSKLKNLSPLRDMPLRNLRITSDDLEDLAPLRGLKLESLDLKCPKVVDLSALDGMPLSHLRIRGCGVTDVGVVRAMPLEFFDFDIETVTRGLDVLRGIKSLRQINRQDVEDFFGNGS